MILPREDIRGSQRKAGYTMWLADNWKDYQVIDCSRGEKLERWGNYLLVRPDPQVIWDTPREHKGWRHMNGHYHRSAKGGGESFSISRSSGRSDTVDSPST